MQAATITQAIPDNFDINYVQHLIQNVETSTTDLDRCQHFIPIFSYLLKFPELVTIHPELAFSIRQKAKMVEPSVSDMIAKESVPFELGSEMVQLAEQLLQMTNELAGFDFEEEHVAHHQHNVPQHEYWSDKEDFDDDDITTTTTFQTVIEHDSPVETVIGQQPDGFAETHPPGFSPINEGADGELPAGTDATGQSGN